VDKTDFRENIKMEIMNVSKQDLLDDFEDAPEVTKSGLYKLAYTSEYGQFGGKPYGMMVSNYEFGPGAQDIRLLQHVSAVATMASREGSAVLLYATLVLLGLDLLLARAGRPLL
jgi:type VI secretion system protein ImpC